MSATNGTFAHHVRDAANRFIARRFVPVPVRFGTKKPNLMDGWERLRIETASPAEIRFDIGIVLGEASDGLVDADLDCREARVAALVAYFEAHGKRALGIGYADRRSRVAKRLVNWLARNPDKFVFSRSDAYLQLKDGRDVPSSDKLDPVFRLLEDHRYIRPATGGGFHRGPVPEVYEVNPEWIRGDDSDPNSVDAAPDDFPPPPSEPISEVPNIEPDSEGRASNIRDFGDGFGGEGDKTDRASDPSPSHITDADGVNRLAADIAEWGSPVALDTETTGLDPEQDRVRLIQLCVNGGVFVIDVFALPDPKTVLDALWSTTRSSSRCPRRRLSRRGNGCAGAWSTECVR